MDIISVDNRDPSAESSSKDRIARILESYEAASDVRPDLHQESLQEQASEAAVQRSKFPSSWATQFSVLYSRALKQVTRDRLPLVIAYVQVRLAGCRAYGGVGSPEEQEKDKTPEEEALCLLWTGS